MTGITRDDIVAGKVDEAINEAIGDIFPGAHVAVTWFSAETMTWSFEIVVPSPPKVEVTETATLEEIIAAAEEAVTDAKQKLLTAWGAEVVA